MNLSIPVYEYASHDQQLHNSVRDLLPLPVSLHRPLSQSQELINFNIAPIT